MRSLRWRWALLGVTSLAGCALFDPFPELAPDEGGPLALSDDPRADAAAVPRPPSGKEGGASADMDAEGDADVSDAADACEGDACAGDADVPVDGGLACDACTSILPVDAAAEAGSPSTYLWSAAVMSDTSFEFGPAFAQRPNGDLVLAFSGYGSWQSGTTALPDTGAGDVGLLSVDATGNVTSPKRLDLGGVDHVKGAAFDASGNLWLAGNTQSLGGSTNDRPLVRKLDATATATLVTVPVDASGSTSNIRCVSVDVGSGGHVAIACNGRGVLQYTRTDGSISSLTLATGTSDGIVARIRPSDGRVIWIARIGAEGFDYVHRIAVDAQGDVYVTGLFESASLPFPPLTRVGLRSNAFVAKLAAADGAHVWSAGYGDAVEPAVLGPGEVPGTGTGYGAAGHAVAVDAAGHVAVGGRYRGTVSFSGDQRTGDLPGYFVLLLDAATGARSWSLFGRGSTGRGGAALDAVFDGAGNLGVVGSAYGGGTGTIAGKSFPTYANSSAFAAKVRTSDGGVVWVSSVHATTPGYVEGTAARFLPDGALVFGVQGTAGGASMSLDLGSGTPTVAHGLVGAVARASSL